MYKSLFLAILVSTTSLQAYAQEKPYVEMLHMWRTQSEQYALGAIRDPLIARGVDWYDYATENNFQGVQTEFSKRLSLDAPPTAVQWIVGEEMIRLAQSGAIRKIPIDQAMKDRLHPEVLELVRYEDSLAGIPVGIHTQNHIVFNAKIAADLGLEIPQTWAELISYGETLASHNINLIAASNEQWQIRVLFNAILSSYLDPDEFMEVMSPKTSVEHLIPKFEKAFGVLAELKRYANTDDADKPWEEVSRKVVEGQAFAQVLGDYIVPEYPDRSAIVCSRSPEARFIIWGMDSFVLTRTEDPDALAGQDMLVETILSPEVAAEYIARKGGVPVTRDADISRLDRCSAGIAENWANTAARIWTGGDVWRGRFSALATVAKREWDNEEIEPQAAARRLSSVLGAI